MFQLVSAGIVLALVAVGLYSLPGRTVRHATVLVLLACVLAGVLSACTFKYTVDDTYISLRYARNWARDFGPVFNRNTQQPVEGYTNFLWVAIEALFFRFGVRPEAAVTLAKLLGVAGVLPRFRSCTRSVGLRGAIPEQPQLAPSSGPPFPTYGSGPRPAWRPAFFCSSSLQASA